MDKIRNKKKPIILLLFILLFSSVIIFYYLESISTLKQEKSKNYVLQYFKKNNSDFFSLVQVLEAVDLEVSTLTSSSTAEQCISLTKHVYLALETLICGPNKKNKQALPTIPPNTKINSVIINDNTAYIDFTRELAEEFWGGAANEQLAIYSIVNTVTQFIPIEQVQISIEGDSETSIGGHYLLNRPFKKNIGLTE